MLARAEGGRGTVKRCAGCRAAHLPWNRLGVRDGCGSKLRAGGRAGTGAGASRALLRPSKSSSADWDEACAADACGLCAAVCMERLFRCYKASSGLRLPMRCSDVSDMAPA